MVITDNSAHSEVIERLQELAVWEGNPAEGEYVPSKDGMYWLMDMWEKYVVYGEVHVPVPSAFFAPEGEVEFEWAESILVVNTAEHTGLWLWLESDTEDGDLELDLNLPAHWEWLLLVVSNLYNQRRAFFKQYDEIATKRLDKMPCL